MQPLPALKAAKKRVAIDWLTSIYSAFMFRHIPTPRQIFKTAEKKS
jgi:hypothetical protein